MELNTYHYELLCTENNNQLLNVGSGKMRRTTIVDSDGTRRSNHLQLIECAGNSNDQVLDDLNARLMGPRSHDQRHGRSVIKYGLCNGSERTCRMADFGCEALHHQVINFDVAVLGNGYENLLLGMQCTGQSLIVPKHTLTYWDYDWTYMALAGETFICHLILLGKAVSITLRDKAIQYSYVKDEAILT